MSRPVIAIAGNPNSGKTTLFNRLTGAHAKVANYPGVTVERHEAALALPDGQTAVLLDIPGTYSLSARTAEEQIAIGVLAGLSSTREPDLVLLVVDSTQLARNLYLVLQVLELRQRAVIALNMSDVVLSAGMRLDVQALSRELGGVPVVPVSAARGTGLDELRAALSAQLAAEPCGPSQPAQVADPALEADLLAVEQHLPPAWARGEPMRRRALATWALLSLDEDDELWQVPAPLRQAVLERRRLAEAAGRDLDLLLVSARYRWIDERMPRFVERQPTSLRRVTDAIDRVLIHPVAGFLLFLLIMAAVFESLFTWSAPFIDGIDGLFSALGAGLRLVLPAGLATDFLVDGIVAGVGGVLVFLPQILLLFLFLSIMEDSGYMARVAFLMDRVMKSIGLTGRAFVPMLSGYACAIPAIMATRTMERRRERLLTMMVVPLMTCSARLPVYTLLIGALFPAPKEPGGTVLGFLGVQALIMVAMYAFGTLMALLAAGVLGRTVLRGAPAPLLLELPPYRLPQPRSVLRMMWERSRLFVTEAGSVILVCSIALWLLLSFPRHDPADALPGAEVPSATAQLRSSWGGQLGRLIEPVIEPLGFDWKIGVGLIGSFAAREVFVSTMSVVYGIAGAEDGADSSLRERLRSERWPDGRRVYTPLVGLSLMVFFALAAQCMSTLAVVRRETASWRWPTFLFCYMTVLAWLMSWITYQGGLALGFT
ncbi:MAG: ferrous iron transport protein B [Planctomycetota bacterium]